MLEVQLQDTFTPLGASHRGCHTLLLCLIGLGKRCLSHRSCLGAMAVRARKGRAITAESGSGRIRTLVRTAGKCWRKLNARCDRSRGLSRKWFPE